MEDFKPLLRNSSFKYLWTSQVLSQVTINVMNFLLLLRLFAETGSSIATSLLWVFYALPAILVGPFASAYVDMVDRRKMLVVTNLLQAATIFAYAYSQRTSLFLLYGVVLLYSFFNQFYVPAEQASLPAVVKQENLAGANGLFFLTQQTAIVLGFGIAGILEQAIGYDRSLYLCAGLLFIAFVSVFFLPTLKTRDTMPKSFEKAFTKFFDRIFQGYLFIKDNKSILSPFLLLLALQVALAIIVVNLPVVATDLLRINLANTGLLLIVPAGVGAVVSALSVPKILNRGVRKKKVIEQSLFLMSFAFFLFVFIVPEIKPDNFRLISGIVATFLAGMSFVGTLIPAQTFLQEKTPGGLRGRVFGNFWFLVTIATVFPVIFSGAIAELFGIRILLSFLVAFALMGALSFKRYGNEVLKNGAFFFLNGHDKKQ